MLQRNPQYFTWHKVDRVLVGTDQRTYRGGGRERKPVTATTREVLCCSYYCSCAAIIIISYFLLLLLFHPFFARSIILTSVPPCACRVRGRVRVSGLRCLFVVSLFPCPFESTNRHNSVTYPRTMQLILINSTRYSFGTQVNWKLSLYSPANPLDCIPGS